MQVPHGSHTWIEVHIIKEREREREAINIRTNNKCTKREMENAVVTRR